MDFGEWISPLTPFTAKLKALPIVYVTKKIKIWQNNIVGVLIRIYANAYITFINYYYKKYARTILLV